MSTPTGRRSFSIDALRQSSGKLFRSRTKRVQDTAEIFEPSPFSKWFGVLPEGATDLWCEGKGKQVGNNLAAMLVQRLYNDHSLKAPSNSPKPTAATPAEMVKQAGLAQGELATVVTSIVSGLSAALQDDGVKRELERYMKRRAAQSIAEDADNILRRGEKMGNLVLDGVAKKVQASQFTAAGNGVVAGEEAPPANPPAPAPAKVDNDTGGDAPAAQPGAAAAAAVAAAGQALLSEPAGGRPYSMQPPSSVAEAAAAASLLQGSLMSASEPTPTTATAAKARAVEAAAFADGNKDSKSRIWPFAEADKGEPGQEEDVCLDPRLCGVKPVPSLQQASSSKISSFVGVDDDDDPDLLSAMLSPLITGFNRALSGSAYVAERIFSGLSIDNIRDGIKCFMYQRYLDAMGALEPSLQGFGKAAGAKVLEYISSLDDEDEDKSREVARAIATDPACVDIELLPPLLEPVMAGVLEVLRGSEWRLARKEAAWSVVRLVTGRCFN